MFQESASYLSIGTSFGSIVLECGEKDNEEMAAFMRIISTAMDATYSCITADSPDMQLRQQHLLQQEDVVNNLAVGMLAEGEHIVLVSRHDPPVTVFNTLTAIVSVGLARHVSNTLCITNRRIIMVIRTSNCRGFRQLFQAMLEKAAKGKLPGEYGKRSIGFAYGYRPDEGTFIVQFTKESPDIIPYSRPVVNRLYKLQYWLGIRGMVLNVPVYPEEGSCLKRRSSSAVFRVSETSYMSVQITSQTMDFNIHTVTSQR
eukprot:gene2540-3290_t